MITLYSKDGLKTKAKVHKFSYQGTFMGECFLSATLESEMPISFEIGDYCMYRGERFELNYIPAKEKQAKAGSYGSAFKYENIKFNSLADELTRIEFLDIVLYDNGVHFSSLPDFSFFSNGVQELADRIQANLDAEYKGDKKWTVQVLPELVTADKTISVSGKTVWEALALVNTEFKANYIIRNRTIIIGTSGFAVGKVFGYGKGNGLYDIQQITNEDAKIITRLHAYGNTRNLPYKYYNGLVDANGNPYISKSNYIPNLMLPDFPYNENDPKKIYIQSNSIQEYGIKYGSVYFDDSESEDSLYLDIYPTIEGMTRENLANAGVTVSLPNGDNGIINEALGAENPTDDGVIPLESSGKTIPKQFLFYLKDLGFDLTEKDSDGQYKYATTDTMQISMKSGKCVGRTFDVVDFSIKKDTSLGYARYVVECNRFEDTSVNMAYPNSDWKIEAGDKFVILGIALPEVYIKSASQRLLEAAKEYLSQNDSTKYTYIPKIDELFMARNPKLGESIKEGDLFNFTDTDLDIDGSVIIQTLTINGGDKLVPTYEVSLSNERITNTIEKIQNSINSLQSNSVGLSMDSIKSLISSIGSKLFLSKTSDDSASGNMTFMQDVSVNKNMLVNRNMQVQGTAVSDVFQNSTFTSGAFGSGFQIKNDSNGNSYGEIDYLTVRKEMYINELIIKKISSIGGSLLLSLASMKTIEIEDKGTYWRCYFDNDNGNITNDFQLNDQAICQIFTGKNIKRYWCLVVGVGSNYIDLSKTDKDGSGVPSIGDEIIQLGNRTNVNRQSARLITTTPANSDSMLEGVNSFDLTGKEVTAIKAESLGGTHITGSFTISTNGTTAPIYKDTGLFENGRVYYLNDRVSHLGSYWVCIVANTIQTPNETSSVWRKDTTGITDINNAVDNIQLGGRNYLYKEFWQSYWTRLNVDSGTNKIEDGLLKLISGTGKSGFIKSMNNYITDSSLIEGSDCMLSFDIKSVEPNLDFAMYISTTTMGLWNQKTSTEWKRFSFPINYEFAKDWALCFNFLTSGGKIYYVRNIQLEKGNKVSDYKLSDEDLQADIATSTETLRSEYKSDFSVLDARISSKVSQTDFSSLQGRVSTTESNLIQQSNQISSTVEKVDRKNAVYKSYTTASTDYPSVPYSKGDLWITYDGTIKQAKNTRITGSFIISDWIDTTKYTDDTAINNLQIGGTNLLLGSLKNETSNAYGFARISNVKLEAGQTYTLSFNGRIDQQAKNDGKRLLVALYNSDYSFYTEPRTDSLIDTTVSATVTPSKDETVTILSYLHSSGGSRLGKATLNWYKLEKGTKATDWSPNPNEVQADINAAQSTADSKNRTYYSDTQPSTPSGGFKVGDMWYKINTIDDYYESYRWNGSTWQQVNVYVSKAKQTITDRSITNLVESTGINSLGDGETLYSKIDQTAKQITLEVNKIQIGGSNYVKGSDIYITTGNRNFDFMSYKDFRGQAVTISVDIELISATGNRIGFEPSFNFVDGTSQYIGVWHYVTSNPNFKGRISKTFTIQDKEIIGMTQRGIYIQCSGALTKVGRPQLEISNKASDWSPATEDIPDIVGSSLTLTDNKISLASTTIELKGTTIAKAIQAESLNVNNKAIINTDGSASFGGGTTVFNVDGSGKTANGNISWDAKGDTTMKGDFIGKISSNSNGDKIVIDPSSKSFSLTDNKNNTLGSWTFFDIGGYYTSSISLVAKNDLKTYSRTSITGAGINLISSENGLLTLEPNYISLKNGASSFEVNTGEKLALFAKNLPTSKVGLSKDQLWRSGDTIKIVI